MSHLGQHFIPGDYSYWRHTRGCTSTQAVVDADIAHGAIFTPGKCIADVTHKVILNQGLLILTSHRYFFTLRVVDTVPQGGNSYSMVGDTGVPHAVILTRR